jgi:hypothetical protein
MNLILWGGVGAYSTYLQIFILVLFFPSGVAIPVSLVWVCIYLSGFALAFKCLKVAKLFLNYQSRQGLNISNPENPVYQPGYGNPQGYNPGNGYQPYSGPAQPVNYFAPGTNVYYAHPMNNPPPGPPAQGGNHYQ